VDSPRDCAASRSRRSPPRTPVARPRQTEKTGTRTPANRDRRGDRGLDVAVTRCPTFIARLPPTAPQQHERGRFTRVTASTFRVKGSVARHDRGDRDGEHR
jgi:hypothetical protein